MKKIGAAFGLLMVGIMVSVILGVVAFSVVAQIIANLSPAPVGTEALILNLVPLFTALGTAMIPIMGVYAISGGVI